MSSLFNLSVEVNGTKYEREVEPRLLLSDFLPLLKSSHASLKSFFPHGVGYSPLMHAVQMCFLGRPIDLSNPSIV